VIRVAEHVARTDTGRQRATNEDSHLERTPVFAVADGMGGAQAGEVASRIAIAHFAADTDDEQPDVDGELAERWLVTAAHEANAEIHALSEADVRRAGMGTTLTAAFVGATEVYFAHVGDSRAYRWRDGELERITEDHSLVEELLRQGRLTEEEAEEHPQRSIITRALGPEPDVDVDVIAVEAADGDRYLLCSDGLTSMIAEPAIAEIMRGAEDLSRAADELVAAALEAGGRDNITVVLFRLEEVGDLAAVASTEELTAAPDGVLAPTEPLPPSEPQQRLAAAAPVARRGGAHPVRRRLPRQPGPGLTPRSRRRRRGLRIAAVLGAVVAVLVIAGVLAAQSIYFISTDANGQVTVYNGLPYTLPGGVRLYTEFFVSGVTAAELSPLERSRLFNDQLRSQSGAAHLVAQLELGEIAGQ
jgi:serine/threonine protein phosphatase PrpC